MRGVYSCGGRRELRVWDGASPLIYRNLRVQWSHNVSAVDASEWGLGVCVARWSREEVKRAGSFSERCRFTRPLFAQPRQAAATAAAARHELPFPSYLRGCEVGVAGIAKEIYPTKGSTAGSPRREHVQTSSNRLHDHSLSSASFEPIPDHCLQKP